MPVRGTTHAIIQKKVINLDFDDGKKVMCAWSDCMNDGYELYKVRVKDSAPGHELKYIQYVFCGERHKHYWIDELMTGRHRAELALN